MSNIFTPIFLAGSSPESPDEEDSSGSDEETPAAESEKSTEPETTAGPDDSDTEKPDDSDREGPTGTDNTEDVPSQGEGEDSDGDTPAVIGGEVPDAETRLERARRVAGHDAATAARVSERGHKTGEFDIPVVAFEDAYPAPIENEIAASHARNLSKLRQRAIDTERATRVAAVARKHAGADVSPSAYLGTYERVFEAVIEDEFERLEEGADPAEVKDDLRASVRTALVDMQVGVDEFADVESVAPLAEDDYASELTLEEALDAIPQPVWYVDDEHTILEYNTAVNRLVDLPDDHRDFLGVDNREGIAAAAYADGSRHQSICDKVAENPRDAEQHWDIEDVSDEFAEFTDHYVYEDTGVTTTQAGTETHIRFIAVPFFDDDGELKGVYELTEDNTEQVRHDRAVTELVTEVTDTLEEIGDGNLDARAHYQDTHAVLEQELLELTPEINEMADSFEQLVNRVGQRASELADSIERATTSAHRIEEQVAEQNDSLESVADEMEDFSATMEEVAASSSEVADAAELALEEAEDGVRAGKSAREVTDEVITISDGLVETVEQLDEYMQEIGDVAEVIAEVADQTNMLALNANIEAARAGEKGEGFAVVADEVKSLANETQEHTEEIASRIETIQRQTVETVDEAERSHEQVQAVETEIDSALESLHTISETVENAAEGIQEVADANDEQAATVEEVTATIDVVRDSARQVADTTENIVDESETQQEAVSNLSERVEEISTMDDRQ